MYMEKKKKKKEMLNYLDLLMVRKLNKSDVSNQLETT